MFIEMRLKKIFDRMVIWFFGESMPELEPRDIMRRLNASIRPYVGFFVLAVLSSLAVSAADSFLSWLIKPIIDTGLVNKHLGFLAWLPIIMLVLFVVRGGASFSSLYFINKLGRRLVSDFRNSLFQHLQALSYKRFTAIGQNECITVMIYNIEKISTVMSLVVVNIIQDVALILGLLFVMFISSWKLSLLFFLVTPLIVLIAKIASKRARFLSAIVQDSVTLMIKSVREFIEGVREIKIYSSDSYEANRFGYSVRHNQNQLMKLVVAKGLSSALMQILISLPIALAIMLVGRQWVDVTAGAFAALLAAMIMLIRPLRRISQANTEIQAGLVAAKTVFDLQDIPATAPPVASHEKVAGGTIVFDDVSYDGNISNRVLQNISLTFPAGKATAIVGPSGCGKTSLINLAMGFLEPSSGCIRYGEYNIQTFAKESYWAEFALVSQHPVLFDATLAENVALGVDSNSIDLARVQTCLADAQLEEIVHQCEQGMHTRVSKQGWQPSGGERQRIALARALYKSASIVILDEATSALDVPTEEALQESINNLADDCTLIMIAHRLSTIRHADNIIVMDQGKVLAQGKHDELMRHCQFYQSLYFGQQGGNT